MFTSLDLSPEDIKNMSLIRDLKAARYKVIDNETGEIEVEYDHTYSGTLEFYFETGMEGVSSNLHDDRGWHESPSWNPETKQMDGPPEKYKSLSWSVFIRGGEYLKVFDKEGAVIWEGLLLRDTAPEGKQIYNHHFLPQGIPTEDWYKWCQEEYRAEIQTNEPVLAEDPKYDDYRDPKDPTILKGDK